MLAWFGLATLARAGVTALSCNDVSDSYVLVGTPAALQIPSGNPLTVEGWMYLNSWDSRDCFYSKNNGRGSPYTYMFGCIDSGDLSAYTGSAWVKPSPAVKVTLGEWCHLAFSYDGTNLTYYLNGESVGTSTFSFNNTVTHTVKIGGYTSSADIDGSISDVRVWDHARGQAQIEAAMSRRLTGSEAGLLGYWRLDEGEGSTAYDATANASDGTLIGATWAATDLELSLFSVAQPETGSMRFTNTNSVDVVFFPQFDGYTHYQITEHGAPPDGDPGAWTSTNTPPETLVFTEPSADTNVVLTAWYTNLTESVALAGAEAAILFTGVNPTAAVVSNVTRPIAVGYTTVEITGDDLDDGSSGGTALGEPMKIHGYALACAADATPGNPAQVTLTATGVFDVAFTVVNEAGNVSETVTSQVSVVQGRLMAWTGQGADTLASTAANWDPAETPQVGDHVVFDDAHYGNVRTNCTWNLDVILSNWTQTTNYTGTVTLSTLYPGQGSFTNLMIAGDCIVDGGVWTHPANTGDTVARDRIALTVDGDFTLGAGAAVLLDSRGYAAARGPGAGTSGQRSQTSASWASAASHGGVGGYNPAGTFPIPCYGSITAPESLGSGSTSRGGGAIRVLAGGAATIDGAISTRGGDNTLNCGGSGGSVFIRAALLGGSGSIDATGGQGYWSGGGGRVALVATNSATAPSVHVNVAGGPATSTARGTSGTYYRRTTALNEVIVDNDNRLTQANIATELPPAYELPFYDPHPVAGGEIEDATLILTNGARAGLVSNLRMGDFAGISGNSALALSGRILYLKADEPSGSFPADYGNGSINYAGGAIVWGDAAPELKLIATNGPNGTVSRDPDEPDDLYPYEAEVTVTAYPATGYALVAWTGDVPDGIDPDENPITVPVDKHREIRALFASTAAGTNTWVGLAGNTLASNPENWYPAAVPTNGANIFLDGTSVREMHWDLDIAVGSWTQTAGFEAFYSLAEGYRGWVVIQTKYPGKGDFTNLVITADCLLESGTWTHPANSGNTEAVDRMSVTVGGNLVLGSNAMIDVYGRGFASARGPGAGNTAQRDAGIPNMVAGSYGGRGGYGSAVAPASCYGSLLTPEALGSGASGGGGGAVRLDVAGQARIDGAIDARGRNASTLQPGPAGGSIWLTAGTLAGEGTLDASSDIGYYAGGGGRVAVHLTDSASFSDVTLLAHSGRHSWSAVAGSGPGTVVKRGSSGKADLVIDNLSRTIAWTNVYAELPASIGGDLQSLRDMRLYLTNRAQAGILTPGVRLRDIGWIDATSRLYLNGHTVIVRSPYHTFTDGDEEVVVVKDGGQLIWTPAGSVIMLR